MKSAHRPWILCVFLGLLCSSSISADSWFRPIGHDLDLGCRSEVTSLSPDGTVALGHMSGPGDSFPNHPFRWTALGGVESIAGKEDRRIGGTASSACDVDGIIVGQMSADAGTGAYLWSDSNGMTWLGALLEERPNSIATAVSASGGAVVGYANARGATIEAFLWTPDAGMRGLGFVTDDACSSAAHAVSADGRVIVGASQPYGCEHSEACAWVDGSVMTLEQLDETSGSIAIGVSADGNVIIGNCYDDRGQVAYIWSRESGIARLFDGNGVVFGISGDAGTAIGEAEHYGPVVWTKSDGALPLVDLLKSLAIYPDGWRDLQVRAVSGDGSIIGGSGTNPEGQQEGWVARLK